MIKKLIITLLSALLFSTMLSAQVNPEDFQYAWGEWSIENNRLVQGDTETGLAKVNIPLIQNDQMVYEFNVRYNGGAEDFMGGFGLHIFVDDPHQGKAWGNGKSYLLWINYDQNAANVTPGFSAQVYESVAHHKMTLVQDYDLNSYVNALSIIQSNPDTTIPVRIKVDATTGLVKIYDPTDSSGKRYFTMNLNNDEPLTGNWISLRSNSLGLSFGM